MSTAISIYHGRFGRASLYQLDRPLTRHAHREGHLTFHVRGTPAAVIVGAQACPLTPVQAAAVNPWEPHEFHPGDRCSGSLFLVLYIRPMWFVEFGRASCARLRFGSPRVEVDAGIGRLVAKVVTLLLDGSSTHVFDGYLYELTEECFTQTHRSNAGAVAPGVTGGGLAHPFGDARVRRSMALMSERLCRGVALDEVARAVGLSRPHFFRLFRSQTGLTPHLFLNTLRMERAIERLTESDRPVSEIGFDLGFSSQSSFTRFFSSNVGLAPACYRRVAHLLPS